MRIRLFPLALLSLGLLATLAACQSPEPAENAAVTEQALPEGELVAYGDAIAYEGETLTPAALTQDPEAYAGQHVRVAGTVQNVCQMRGCWVTLDNPDGYPVRIAVPHDEDGEYAFTFPTDLGPQRLIVEGVAELDTLSVETLRHFAEDEGRPQDYIDAITEPEAQIRIVATGALVEAAEIATL